MASGGNRWYVDEIGGKWRNGVCKKRKGVCKWRTGWYEEEREVSGGKGW